MRCVLIFERYSFVYYNLTAQIADVILEITTLLKKRLNGISCKLTKIWYALFGTFLSQALSKVEKKNIYLNTAVRLMLDTFWTLKKTPQNPVPKIFFA